MRVLVVEDEASLREQLASALGQAGYAVDTAGDGTRAEFLGQTETYDAAVLDLGLPGLDGLTVLRRWREAGNAVPVLVLTARDTWSEKVRGIDGGADDYLTKPFRVGNCSRGFGRSSDARRVKSAPSFVSAPSRWTRRSRVSRCPARS